MTHYIVFRYKLKHDKVRYKLEHSNKTKLITTLFNFILMCLVLYCVKIFIVMELVRF